MRTTDEPRRGVAWLEILLVLAVLALVFQVFPQLWFSTLWALDVRNWSRGVWFVLNIGVVLVLFGIRYAPEVNQEWKRRRGNRIRHRTEDDEQRKLREERELYERMKEARKRQVI
jgi:hypothetical protein